MIPITFFFPSNPNITIYGYLNAPTVQDAAEAIYYALRYGHPILLNGKLPNYVIPSAIAETALIWVGEEDEAVE